MRLLLIHASRFWWRIREPARGLAVKDEPEPEEAELEDVVVCFTAVEEGDGASRTELVGKAKGEVLKFTERIGCRRVVIYPYAHLSTELAKPEVALVVLRAFEEALRAEGLEVIRSPFGYYKEFLLHCKGHPLSEAFREIRP